VCFVKQATILANLKDPDVSIRRRALDLLFTMCDGGAAVEVVQELVRPVLGRGLAAGEMCCPTCPLPLHCLPYPCTACLCMLPHHNHNHNHHHHQVTYLTVADFSMREELVLKIAILAEKFAPSVEVRRMGGGQRLRQPAQSSPAALDGGN
jgi:AP-2 complex subunit alpha